MSSLKLNLADWDAYDYSVRDIIDDDYEPSDKAEYRYSRTTDFRGTAVFQTLNDLLQPESETSPECAIKAILADVPDAPLSNEVMVVGDIIIEIAEQIPYHHPSHVKLARVTEGLMHSPKFITGPI